MERHAMTSASTTSKLKPLENANGARSGITKKVEVDAGGSPKKDTPATSLRKPARLVLVSFLKLETAWTEKIIELQLAKKTKPE